MPNKKQVSQFLIISIIVAGIAGLFFPLEKAKAAVLRDVLINEISWTGSSATDTDKWIELRNASDTAIDVAGWHIDNVVHGATTTLTLNSTICPATTTIPASGYFLISNATSGYSAINNNVTVDCATSTFNLLGSYLLNGALTLRQGATTIDETPASSTVLWPGGAAAPATSTMARNWTPGNGTTTTNWHSSVISTNWDAGVADKGTPKSYNGYSVTGTFSQVNGAATGTIYIAVSENGTTTATTTAGFSATGTYAMHLFQATYDFLAFRDTNGSGVYNVGSEPRRNLTNSGAGYALTSSGTSSLNFELAVDPTISSTTPSTLSIAETLTILGNYFGDSTTTAQSTLTLPNNITTAQITSWSSTSIQVVIPTASTPPGSQTGTLTLQIGTWAPAATTSITIQPIVTSAVGTQNSVTINFDAYMDGAFAMAPGNYTLQSPIGNALSLGSAWAEFRGNKTIIRGINLTANNTFLIQAGSSIRSISGTTIKTASSTATGTVAAAPSITSITPKSGAAGATTTIVGTGFGASAGTVYFSPGPPSGGSPPQPVAATTSSWSATQIIATIPIGAKSGPITITTSGGADSGMSENSFFDASMAANFKVLIPNGNTLGTSTARIIVGKQGGPSVYYTGDANQTISSGSANNATITVPSCSTMGTAWAFDTAGLYVPSAPQQLSATTTTFSLASSTTRISGTITGANANAMLALFANPISGTLSGTSSSDFFQPIFVTTNANGTTTFTIGLSATGTYMLGIEDPGFGGAASSSAKLAPGVQQINASSTTPISGLTFAFTTASARIHGVVQKAAGNFDTGPGIRDFHVWAYQPVQNGLHASAMVSGNGQFDLYVDPGVYLVEVGGPNLPFAVSKQIEVKAGDANFATSNAVTDITLVISAPTEYIAGQVTDSNGNGISGASIFAYSSTGPGGGQAFTDSNGYYKLYTNIGTYTVEGFAPTYGKLTPRNGVILSSSSSTTVDFAVSSEVATISGTVTKNNASSSNLEVWITQGDNGWNLNRTQTNSSGAYSLTVPYGSNYYLHVGKPGVGEIYKEALAVFNSGNTSTSSVIAINTASIIVRISPTTAFSQAFVQARNNADARKQGFANTDTSATTSYREYTIEVPKPTNNDTWTYTIDGGIPGFGPLGATTTAIASTTTSAVKTITLGSIYTVSGTISDPDASTTGNQAEGAFVWASSASGHGGGAVDSSGNFSFPLKTGTYDFGVDKKNYAGNMVSSVAVSSATTVTGLALNSASLAITGQVTKSSVAESGAWVWATNGSGGWTGDETDGSGNYSLKVTAGTWSIKAASEGYEVPTAQMVTIASGTTTLNLALSAMAGYTSVSPTVESMVPSTGGIIQGTNVKFEAPAGALSSQDSSNGRISMQKTTSVPQTNGVKPLGNSAYSISAYNASGTAFTTLNSAVTISLTYSSADLSSAGLTQVQASQLNLGYWDSTANTWTPISTTVSTSTDGSVTFIGSTTHLSDYAPLVASGANPPPTPTNFTATAGDSQLTLSWSASDGANRYYIYTLSGALYPFYASTTATSYISRNLTNGTAYYYKLSAMNSDGDESTSTNAISGTPAASTPPGSGASYTLTTPVMPVTTTGLVTATAEAGGKTTVTASDNTTASVSLPANAITSNTAITVAPVAKTDAAVTTAVATAPSGKSLVGNYVYNFSAAVGTSAVSTFSQSVTLTFTYTDSQITGLNESSLKVYYWNTGTSQWTVLTTTVNAQTNTLTAATNHFTYFAIMGETAAVITPTTPTAATTTPVATTKPVSQMTTAELQAEITRIMALISQLQAQLKELISGVPTITGIPAEFKFKLTLKSKQASLDIKYLQIVLNSDPDTKLAESGVGSLGKETNIFGDLTKAAVIKFQEKYQSEILTPWGLEKGTGIVGSSTRAKLNKLLGK